MAVGWQSVFHRRDDMYNIPPTMRKSLKRWDKKKSPGPGADLSMRGFLFRMISNLASL
jgi:hypothetical protein